MTGRAVWSCTAPLTLLMVALLASTAAAGPPAPAPEEASVELAINTARVRLGRDCLSSTQVQGCSAVSCCVPPHVGRSSGSSTAAAVASVSDFRLISTVQVWLTTMEDLSTAVSDLAQAEGQPPAAINSTITRTHSMEPEGGVCCRRRRRRCCCWPCSARLPAPPALRCAACAPAPAWRHAGDSLLALAGARCRLRGGPPNASGSRHWCSSCWLYTSTPGPSLAADAGYMVAPSNGQVADIAASITGFTAEQLHKGYEE